MLAVGIWPSTSSTAVSSRTKERVKVAELLAEKAMLKRKQALDVAAENLRQETEIAKAEAREKVYGELIDYEEKPLMSVKERKKVRTAATDESTSNVPCASKPRYSHSTSAVSQQKIPLFTPSLSVWSLTDISSSPKSTQMAWDIRHERSAQSTRPEPDPPCVWGLRHELEQRQAWNPRHVPDPRYSRNPPCVPDYVPNPRYTRAPRHVSDYAPNSSCPRDSSRT